MNPAPTYSRVQWEIQSYTQFWVENVCVLVDFTYEKIFVFYILTVLKIFDVLELFLDVEDEQLVDKA